MPNRTTLSARRSMTVLAMWLGQSGTLGAWGSFPAGIVVFTEQRPGSKLSGWQQTTAPDALGWVNVPLEMCMGANRIR